MNKDTMKQSLLIGALASSFGIFVSKLLGLFYYSPLSEFAGESNMVFYSIVYTYYDLLLQVSSAGIPFAIASLVAKYVAKDDYKTVQLVKKLGISFIMALSFVVGIIFILIASPLAKQSLGSSAPIQDIENLKLLFYILTIAVIAVPFLSAIRGYAQGLKRLDAYAASQVLEQFVRVFTIVIGAYIVVKVLNFNSIWAIYIAVAAAALGAIVAILFTLKFFSQDSKHIDELASKQENESNKTKKDIFIEILTLGIPYLIITFLGTAGPLVNTTFFLDYMTKVNGATAYESAKLSAGILQANIAKVSNIPSVLALGFGSGMVPYLSESLVKRDYKKITKQVNQILDTSAYILVPMIAIFVFFGKDVYFIFYGDNNLELGASLFKVSNIQIFLGTIAPIFSSIMMSLRLRKDAIITLIISFIIKLVTFFPCVKYFGAYGMIYSSGLYYLLQIIMYFISLRINFRLSIKQCSRRFLLICVCSLIMILPVYLLHGLLEFVYTSRLICVFVMGVLGIIMLVTYYFATYYCHLIQTIFGIKDISIKKLLKKFRP